MRLGGLETVQLKSDKKDFLQKKQNFNVFINAISLDLCALISLFGGWHLAKGVTGAYRVRVQSRDNKLSGAL